MKRKQVKNIIFNGENGDKYNYLKSNEVSSANSYVYN